MFPDDKLFKIIDYGDEGEDSIAFDPLAPSFGTEAKVRRFDDRGKFVPDTDSNWVAKMNRSSSGPTPTKAEQDLVPMVEAEHSDEYGWWRKESGYLEWLDSQGFPADKIDNYTGNKLFTEYIAYKAQHPEGFMKFSSDVMDAVGGVIRSVSDTLSKVPGIKHVAKPVGSILQFIGNLFDLPRNVLAGAFTALSTDNADEILPNILQAFKFSIGNITGNEGEGKYFSWMDGKLLNLVEKAKQGMNESEYKAYINSDSFRKTKRFWQTGGMLLDLALDPAWIVGAAAAKSFKAAKQIGAMRPFINDVTQRIAEAYKISDPLAQINRQKAFASIARDMNSFTTKTEKLVDFVRADEGFLKAIKMDGWDFANKGLLETLDEISGKFNAVSKGDLKSFGYSMRLKFPGTRDIKLSPSIDPLVDAVLKKIGGKERGFLNIKGRYRERAAMRVGTMGWTNEVIFKGRQDLNQAIDALLKSPDELIRKNAAALKSDPSLYEDFTAALLESNLVPMLDFISIPGEHGAKMTALFEVNRPLFESIMTTTEVQRVRKSIDMLMRESYKGVTQAQQEYMVLLRTLGMSEDAMEFFGEEARSLSELVLEGGKKGRKVHGARESSVAEKLVEGPDARFLKASQEWEAKFTKYYRREFTPEAIEHIKKLHEGKPGKIDEALHVGQLAPDPVRRVYIPVDYKNGTLQKLLFNPEELPGFLKLLDEDEPAAFLAMNKRITELSRANPEKFNDLTKMTNVIGKDGRPLMFGDVPIEKYVDFDVRPLISQGSVSLMNSLSQKGLIFEGFTGRLYKGGLEPVFKKVLADQQIIERLDSVASIFSYGQQSGFLKKLSPAAGPLGPEWKVQDQGIFKGFAVKEYLEKSLHSAVKGISHVAETMANDPWILRTGKGALSSFNRWWKVNIFMKSPSAHSRNFVSNRMIMLGDGIGLFNSLSKEAKMGRKVWNYYRTAEKYQNDVFKGLDAAPMKNKMIQQGTEMIEMAGTKMTVMEATEILMRENVLSSGFTNTMMNEIHKANEAGEFARFKKMSDEFERSFIRKINPFGIKDYLAKGMQTLGSSIENAYGRLEYFFTLTNKKGMMIGDASAQVNKMLIDYGRIGKMEDSLRKYLIPFYTWQSRMIPIMLQKAIEQPAYFTKITQLKNNAYKILELDRNFAPMGEEQMEGIPMVGVDLKNIGKFFRGRPLNEIKTQYISGEGWLPQAVVNLFEPSRLRNLVKPDRPEEWLPLDLIKKIGIGATEWATRGLTPLLKLPVESVSGYSFQFKRPLVSYPGQTVSFLGREWDPKKANWLRSLFTVLRQADDIVNIWEKNAITGQPKYTVYDVMFKNLLGYRPYNRNEIREINGAMGELRDLYMGNLSDARKMVHNPKQARKHALAAIEAMHGIKILEWYKEFATEVRDKEATIRGIEEDIETLQERAKNKNLSRKQRAKIAEDELGLQERLAAFIADQEKF